MMKLIGKKVNMFDISDRGLSNVLHTGTFASLGLDVHAKLTLENGEKISLDNVRMRKS